MYCKARSVGNIVDVQTADPILFVVHACVLIRLGFWSISKSAAARTDGMS